VRGCAVNGPGEAAHADIGVAFGNGNGNAMLFENGVRTGAIASADIVSALASKIRLIV
jgi:(E)-4-hydroxy-3-methylbut-2-enyl-diphosphate synthase